MRRQTLAILALCSVMTPMTAAADWTPPSPLQVGSRGPFPYFEPNGQRQHVEVAMDDSGNAMAVWSTPTWYGLPQSTGSTIKSAYRPARGTWQPAVYPGDEGAHGVPSMAMNGRGDIFLAWGDGWAYHLPGEPAWVRPQTFDFGCAGAGSGCTARPRVAIDKNGAGVVVWARNGTVETRTVRRGTTEWIMPATLSASGGRSPDIAGDDETQEVVAWAQTVSGGEVARIARRAAGSVSWDQVDISTVANTIERPATAVSDNGDAAAVWEQTVGGRVEVHASIRRATGGGWGSPQRIGVAQESATSAESAAASPRIGLDANGNAVVTYQRYAGGSAQIMVSTLIRNTVAWPSPQGLGPVTPGSGVWGPSLSVARDGSALIGSTVGLFERSQLGPWIGSGRTDAATVRAVAINDTGFKTVVSERAEAQPANEVDQPVAGRWVQVYGTSADPALPPPPDRDGDGVPDANDVCPDAPGSPEHQGCVLATVAAPVPAARVCPPDCSFSGVRTGLTGRWRGSRFIGSVVVTGRSNGATPLTVVVRPPSSPVLGSRPIAIGTSVSAGTFKRRMPVRGRYAPGKFEVTVLDANGRVVSPVRRVTRLGPATGVIAKAWLSRTGQGSPANQARNWNMLTARFQFASRSALPRGAARRRLKVYWNGPGRYKLSTRVRANINIRSRFNPPRSKVPKGLWVVQLKAGKKTLSKLRIRVR